MPFNLEKILATDSFFRANENPLNPAVWTTVTGFDALQVVSDACEASVDSSVNVCGARYTGVSWPNDQFVQITLTHMANLGELDIFLRSDAGTDIGYDILLQDNGSGGLEFDIIVNPPGPVAILLFSNPNLPYSLGDIFKASVIGQQIVVTQNGVVIASVVDPNVVSGTPAVVFDVTSTGDIRITNFVAGTTAGQPYIGAPMPTS